MKFTLIIDPEREEEVLVYAHKKSGLTERIAELAEEACEELFGYLEGRAVKLDVLSVCAFAVEDSKVFAITDKGRFAIRERLYRLEERFGDSFVKINQSCLVRVDSIEKFDASIGGSLMVTTRCGYRDYVSRRQLKSVKERIGI